jgi:photoactive yellow protein
MIFEQADVLSQLVAADRSQLDAAAFGIIGLDTDHRVVSYNTYESELSGLTPDSVMGLHFFTEVAPCTNNYMVAQRYESEPDLDATIDYVFTFRIRPTPVQLRMLASTDAERSYLLVRRAD